MFQIGGSVYEGRYKDTIGTHILVTPGDGTCIDTAVKELKCNKVSVVPKTNESTGS